MSVILLNSTKKIHLFVIIFLLSIYSNAQTNIVNQPFSSAIPSGWSADLSSWTLNYNYATNDHTPNDYCASISDGKPSKFIYIPVTMVSGAKYDISFWTKRIGGVTVYVNETSDQVTPLFTYTGTQTLDNNWRQTICPSYIALVSGQVYIQIAYTGSTYGSGTAYLDDVKVIETSSGNQNSWSITGSGGTNMVSNFIGTTDAQGLVFKTNNIERAQFDLTGAFILKTSAIFKEDIKLEKGFTFDGNKGISFTPSTASSPAKFHYGNKPTSILPINCAAGPQALANHQFGGMLQIYDADASGNYVANSGLLNFQTWSGGSSIDASIGGQIGQGGLLLNYFCGNNTYINTGVNGGKVSMGKLVEIGFPYPPSNSTALNIKGDLNYTGIDLKINHNSDYSYGFVETVNRDLTKAIGIFNTSSGLSIESVAIYGDGSAHFGKQKIASSHLHANAQFQFDGKIGCKELVVVDPTKWADFVFEKNYNLMPLFEVEKYIKQNKHLPSVPSEKEVKQNGINTAEMDAILLQKIEELTLYIVQQQKEIEILKKESKK